MENIFYIVLFAPYFRKQKDDELLLPVDDFLKNTTHSQLSEKELKEQGIAPNTIRLSIGTEHIDDILEDLGEA